MLTRIAVFTTRFPRAVLLVALAAALLCGGFGMSVTGHLKSGGFTESNAESTQVSQLLARHFDGAEPNFVLLVQADGGVDSAAARQVGTAAVATLQGDPRVIGLRSYWTSPANISAALRSTDGKSALILAYLTGGEDQTQQTAGDLAAQVHSTTPGVTVRAGGGSVVFHDVSKQVTTDLAVAEGVAIPLSLIVLILVFGSLVAAALPLVVGIFAILVTLAILRGLTLISDASIYALNMTTALGLALAIDYSLFIVSRYREELANGLEPRAAVIRSVQTAGRTVLFSALTVALALAVLSVFDLYFLQSLAYAGVAVVLAAAAAAVVILPAALILLGTRVNALDLRAPIRRLLRRDPPVALEPEQTRWYRMVNGVMRRAIPVSVVLIALLIALGSPFLGVKFGYPDDRVLPTSATSRSVGDAVRTEFPAADTGSATTIVLDGYHGDAAAIGSYAAALSKVNGVSAVLSSSGVYLSGARMGSAPAGFANDTGQYLTVATKFDPFSPDGKRQLSQLRQIPPPGPALYGGAAAVNADSLRALSDRLPLAAVLIALTAFIVLFLFTGSVVLPLKALLLNTLSLTAAFGAMVWIFQQGHLSGLLGFTAVGYLVPTMPILMFCMAFGLSMDYEVFLLSRIREAWLESGRTAADNTHAVAVGVARTGRIFTAAALLMAIVLGAMISAKVSFMQLFGLGLTVTVLVDATLIRALLVPALMRLMGRYNWWAPAPLARLHARIGLSENASEIPLEVREPVGTP